MLGPQMPQSSRLNTARAWPMVVRLFAEYALPAWKSYAVALILIAIVAASTALIAYLFGDFINQVVVNRNLMLVLTLSIVIVVVFMIKGFANYGHAVMLARISNHIVAANQRLLFEKLINQNLSFFA